MAAGPPRRRGATDRSLSRFSARMYRLLAADRSMPSTRAVSSAVSSSKWRRTSTSRSIGSSASSASWSRSFRSARIAATLGRVSRPRSCAARAAEVAPGIGPSSSRTSRAASRAATPRCLRCWSLEGHAREPAEPEEERQLGPLQVLRQGPGGLKARLLDHVGRVDPPEEPAIEPQRDHPAQPGAVRLQQLGPGRRVALGRPA